MGYHAAAARAAEGIANTFGEPADYSHPGLADPMRVRAVWGEVGFAANQSGMLVDTCEVEVPAADLGAHNPRDAKGSLKRFPDTAPETWEITAPVRFDGVWYSFTAWRLPRQIPRR